MPRWRSKISTGTKEPLNSPTQSGTSGSDPVGAGCSTSGAGAVATGAGASRCLVAPPGTPERSEEDKVDPPGLQACYQHPLRPPTPDQDIVKRLSLSALKCGICHKQAVCGCPICGVTTNMVTPSKTWPKSPADKAAIVTAYHNKLANIDCKEFRGGEGICKFGSRCLYRHKCKATRPPRATAGAGQAQRAGRAARAVAVDPPQRQRQPKSASGDRGGGGAQQGS
ncbi:C3H1-type domain-containing protein [Haematococcus lacustris]|uniref:C3H1-type domain-containing protein n=1 Tax=Haematococcus lacustris TaxID=44745 RepID=A0A699YY37_HAELA|nr:C3H1-type domain-containing protein [Haematococcus lacustris]